MTRHHQRFGWDDGDAHGLGEVARRNAQADYRDKFDTEQRTQNMPGDFGTRRTPEPFDRDLHGEPYHRYDERYGEDTGRERARGYRGRGPKNYTRSDQRILEDICERLWDADDVDASDVTVQVQDSVVTLSGNVEQRRIKHHIEDIVDACGGVTDIHNEVRVQPRNEWPYDKGVAPGSTGDSSGKTGETGNNSEGMIQSAIENMPPREPKR